MKTSQLTKSYHGKSVLDLPELSFEKGRVHAIIGANGSGKTTLARILAGVLQPDGPGCIHPEPRERIRYLPQKSYPFRLKVRRSILLGSGSDARLGHLAERLSLGGLLGQNGHRLSGGESARVGLARVLMDDCDLLILDEPTAAMDMQSTLAAERLVLEYRDRCGCAVLWVTHSIAQAERTADRLLFLEGGQLMESRGIKEALAVPESEALKRFLAFYRIS